MPAISNAPPGWVAIEGRLASIRRGAGPRLVFVHGFTQTAVSWLQIAEHFVHDFEVVLIDAPGHGGSHDVRSDMRLSADLLVSVGGTGTYVGYSLGGRLCLQAAVSYPSSVARLALIGATAGITDDEERLARRASDEALANEIELNGVQPFVEQWLTQPLFRTLPVERRGLTERLTNTAAGLASSLRLTGTGTQLPLWNQLGQITAPTLVMAGELDPKFTALGQQITAEIPGAMFRSIAGAGHAADLEYPTLTAATLRAWLDATRYAAR